MNAVFYCGRVNHMSLKENLTKYRDAAGITQKELAQMAGCSQQVIADIESGRTLKPRNLTEIATALGVPVEQLDPDRFKQRAPMGSAAPSQGALLQKQIPLSLGHKDLPIFAAAEGGNGAMIVTFEPIDYMRRPTPLEHIRDGYGVYIVGESMAPAYEPGDIALINPLLPPSPGRDAIFLNPSDHSHEALIKRLVRATSREWLVQQWNPKKEFSLSRSQWGQCHIVVGKYVR